MKPLLIASCAEPLIPGLSSWQPTGQQADGFSQMVFVTQMSYPVLLPIRPPALEGTAHPQDHPRLSLGLPFPHWGTVVLPIPMVPMSPSPQWGADPRALSCA